MHLAIVNLTLMFCPDTHVLLMLCLIYPFRPQVDAHCQWKAAYKYFNIVLDGLQGLIVSVAFCYRNGEVRKCKNLCLKVSVLCSS